MVKLVAGNYDKAENVLHLWFPEGVDLKDEQGIVRFFDEVINDWIVPCPIKPWLLVNYDHLHIRANMASIYANNIKRFQPYLLGTFRYALTRDADGHFTSMAVILGNINLAAPANIFPDEAAARLAIRQAKVKAGPAA